MKSEYVIRVRPRTAFRWAAGCVVVVIAMAAGVYTARAPILAWIGSQLVHSDPLAKVDAIVVLAGGVPEREIEAADLYAAGYAPRIVITRDTEHSGFALLKQRGIRTADELDERLRYLRELGVPHSAVTVLGIARSTDLEAVLLADWARSSRPASLMIVTSAFHTGRARYAFEHAFRELPVRLQYRAASLDAFRAEDWWRDPVTFRNGIIEWQKQLYYRLRVR